MNVEAVGFWAVAISPQQDLIKWGQDGDTVMPYTSIVNAADQIAFLKESKEHRHDRFYILKVFANGQMVTIEAD